MCGRGKSLCRCEVQLAQRRLECFVPAHHRCCHSAKRCSAPTPAPSQTPLCSAHPMSQKSVKSAPFAAWDGFDLQPGGLGTDEAQAVFGTLVFRSLLPQAGRYRNTLAPNKVGTMRVRTRFERATNWSSVGTSSGSFLRATPAALPATVESARSTCNPIMHTAPRNTGAREKPKKNLYRAR